jgi:hypothetical protein
MCLRVCVCARWRLKSDTRTRTAHKHTQVKSLGYTHAHVTRPAFRRAEKVGRQVIEDDVWARPCPCPCRLSLALPRVPCAAPMPQLACSNPKRAWHDCLCAPPLFAACAVECLSGWLAGWLVGR